MRVAGLARGTGRHDHRPRAGLTGPVVRRAVLQPVCVALGRAYDPAVADLYADDATIQSVQRNADNTVRTLRLIGEPYKRLIRSGMPLARERGDRDRYSDVSVSAEGPRARIRCTRYNELKRYASPYELVLERSGDSWQIIEEYSESHASVAAGRAAPGPIAREPISPEQLQAAADKLSNFTPMMVDSITELSRVLVEGRAIVYEYRLVGIDTLAIHPTSSGCWPTPGPPSRSARMPRRVESSSTAGS